MTLPTTTTAVRLDPEAIYDDDFLHKSLGIPYGTLTRARRNGSLRFTRRGNRTLYLGAWVIEWLTEPAKKREG